MFLKICQEIRYIISLIVESNFNEIRFNEVYECKKERYGKLILVGVAEITVKIDMQQNKESTPAFEDKIGMTNKI